MFRSFSIGYKLTKPIKWIHIKIRKLILFVIGKIKRFILLILTNIKELAAVSCVLLSLFTPLTKELDPEHADVVIGLGTAAMASYFMYARTRVTEENKKLTKENIVKSFLLGLVIITFTVNTFIKGF